MKNLSQDLNWLYSKGYYDEFLSKLIENKSNYRDDFFYYNLGVVNFAKDNYALSLYNFKKSLRITSELQLKKNILKNIEILKKSKKVKEIRKDNLSNIADNILVFKGHSEEIFLVFILIIIMVFNIFKKKFAMFIASFFVLIALSFGFCISFLKSGMVVDNLKIYEGPSKIFEIKEIANVGQEVIVLSKNDYGWFKIILPTDLSGWGEKKDIVIY